MAALVILSAAAFLLMVGFVGWILGFVFGHAEVAAIGAVIVVGVGAMITLGGLQHRTGEIRSTNATTNTTTIDYQYSDTKTPDDLPLGAVTMLLGGMGVIRALDRARYS